MALVLSFAADAPGCHTRDNEGVTAPDHSDAEPPEGGSSAIVAVADHDNPMHRLLGGWRGGLESALPSVVFASTYVIAGLSLTTALVAAVVVALILTALRLLRHEKPVRAVGGLLAVGVAALVAARTGNAADYFLPSLLANAVSALAWALSILVGWPLLGVVVGFAVGQRTSWRADPDLVRAYSRASWVWTASFVIRAGVQGSLWASDNVIGLGIARVVLGWPMVLLVIAASWWVVKRTLPPGHPGLLHPRVPASTADTVRNGDDT